MIHKKYAYVCKKKLSRVVVVTVVVVVVVTV